MLDSYIIDQIRRDEENARARTQIRAPLSDRPGVPPPPPKRSRLDECQTPAHGVTTVNFHL